MNNYRQNRILSAVFYRLHYLILAALAFLLYIEYRQTYTPVVIALFAVYIALFELFMYRSGKNSRAAAQNIISMLDMTSQKRITEFPLPIVISSSDGTVIWQSELFIDTVGEERAREVVNLSEIDKGLPDNPVTSINISGRSFDVFSDCSRQNGTELYIHYFVDTTSMRELESKYDDIRPAVAHILIDNYDELFNNVREADKNQALSQIYDAVRGWATATSGLLLRTERDRFVFIFDNSVLKKESEKRFSILDSVKELKLGLRTFPTLSIGVGFDGESYSADDDNARMAIDMALSRGGDQAVIKTASGYEFFGGTAKAAEKTTRIKARVIATALKEIFKSLSTVYIMGHKYGDLDSLGACVGFYRLAVSQGKKAFIVLDEASNLADKLYEQLKLSGDYEGTFITPAQVCEAPDPGALTVVVDTHRPSYVMAPELLGKTKHCIVIDHHRKSVDYITDTDVFFHDPAASSACEMVSEIIPYMPDCILTKLESEALMSGIFLDTKFFTIRTSASTFEASLFLKKSGANTVNVKMLFQTDMETYKDKVLLMHNAEIYRDITAIAVWSEITTQPGSMKIVSSQACDDLLNIENVHAAFTMFEDNFGVINISARSYGVINVQLIMEDLGGGGHQTMSGAQMNCSLEEAGEKLKLAIDNYLNVANIKWKVPAAADDKGTPDEISGTDEKET